MRSTRVETGCMQVIRRSRNSTPRPRSATAPRRSRTTPCGPSSPASAWPHRSACRPTLLGALPTDAALALPRRCRPRLRHRERDHRLRHRGGGQAARGRRHPAGRPSRHRPVRPLYHPGCGHLYRPAALSQRCVVRQGYFSPQGPNASEGYSPRRWRRHSASCRSRTRRTAASREGWSGSCKRHSSSSAASRGSSRINIIGQVSRPSGPPFHRMSLP